MFKINQGEVIMNSIFTRRSIRAYDAKPVEPAKIEKLLRAAMQAPSAANQQPWKFITVQNRILLGKLSEVSEYAKMLHEAALAIIVIGDMTKCIYPIMWEQDLSAATQNILLEAVELKLGAVWLGVAPLQDRMDFISRMFELPITDKPFSVISIGYPAGNQENRFIDRYKPERVKNY